MLYRLAQNVELLERKEGLFLLLKTPLCVLRLNRSLADLVGRGAGGALINPSEGEVPVMEQLAAKGFVERLPDAAQRPVTLPDISIIIPVKDRADELKCCLTSLANLNYPQEKLQVIVVDDGSSDDSPLVARQFQAVLAPSGGTGRGPAAARNVGASLARGEILAFIDSDCTASPEWLNELIPAFNNPVLAAVGGQVDGMCTESAVDRYESIMSSLSLGARERTGSSGSDTFYLPSCNLLVRLAAFRSAGGFKDEMHVGEDVDLTWRLRDKGWAIMYLPAGNVLHKHRSSIRSFMSRRFDYGTSEGMLQRLHPRRRKQMVVPPLLAIMLACCLITPFAGTLPLFLAMGLLAADTITVRVRFARRGLPVGILDLIAGRLRALGSLDLLFKLSSGALLCRSTDRYCADSSRFLGLGFAGRGPVMRRRGRPCCQEASCVVHPFLRDLFSGTACVWIRSILGLFQATVFFQLPGCPAPAYGAVCIAG